MSLEAVFWGFSLYDLVLTFGRFVIAISGSLLAALNVMWLLQRRYRVDKRAGGTVRATIEASVGGALAVIYWREVYALAVTGSAGALTTGDTLVVIWLFAAVLTGLLIAALTTAGAVTPPHHDRHGDPPAP